MDENTKISAIYPDGEIIHTTIFELKIKFLNEKKSWQKEFFNNLINKGISFGYSAIYKLIK